MTEENNQIQSHNKGVLKINEFRKFIEWYALPDVFRNPKTQKEFAKENNLNEATLVDWKKITEFKEETEKAVKAWTWDKNRNVILAVYKSAIEGNAASQRLWAEWQQEWIPKQENRNLNVSFEDLINEIEKNDKQQKDNRGDNVDSEQGGKASEVSSEQDTSKIREGKNE